jgi:hypothetical protein
MTEAMPTVLPESGVTEFRKVQKAQLFTGAFGSVSVDEKTGDITAPISPEGDKSFLGLLADRESAGGENRNKISDDGKRTRGTFHITLETAMGLENEFPFVKEYKTLNTQNRDRFGQYIIDNPDVEREMALAVRNQKLSELENAGVKLNQLNQNEINAVSLLFFNTGTAKSPKLKRNLAALTNYKALFGETPTPDELDILNQLKISVAGQMDHINTDGVPSRGLALRRLAEQDLFLRGEDTFRSYQPGGDRAESVSTTNRAKRLVSKSREDSEMRFDYATTLLKTQL